MRAARVDRTLLYLSAVLITVGILIFFSASLSLIAKDAGAFGGALISQILLGLCGGVVMLVAALRIPLRLVRTFAPHFFLGTLVLTAATLIPGVGVEANGATRWLDFGITTFQPSELLKLGYVAFLAALLASGRNRGADLMHGVLPFALVTSLVALVLLLQPDTDTVLVAAVAGIAMLFAVGMRVRDLVVTGIIGIVLVAVLLFARPYLWERVETFFDPSRDPLGAGYQIQQSLIAIGSGGLTGRGYGQSIQKFNYLPEASSDSIFAVHAEEFGFVGSVLLVAGFLFFSLRGLWVAARAQELFGALLTLGIVVLIGFQAILNIAGMLALVPVGGLPLPLVSHGGSALLVTLFMIGLVLNVSKTVRAG